MATHGKRTSADNPLILALASGKTVTDAARDAGVSVSTAHRRMADGDFRRQVAAARTDALARAVGQLADASTAAVQTLRSLLDADADTVRLGAARAILDQATRGVELLDLAERLAALESQMDAAKLP